MKFCSLGKEYIKVYIASVEQTNVDVNSISITKAINASHTASFELGQAYDSTKPDMKAEVEIKYHIWTLYKGYITAIIPTESPESIRINCQDKYWQQNRTNKYFFVGHKPQDNKEKYYNTIKEALSSECSFEIEEGDFIPQTMSCFGQGESDCITSLITNAGNFGWFYKLNNDKKLWKAGQGDIIYLERQVLDTNIGLYQVLRHQFRESIDNIINKLRVQMGEEIVRQFDEYGGVKRYTGYRFSSYQTHAVPAWSVSNERLAKNSFDGYGFDYHSPQDDPTYRDVFRKWELPYLDGEISSWTDTYPPRVEFYAPGTWVGVGFPMSPSYLKNVTEGFTIDYENGYIVFNEPMFVGRQNDEGELYGIRAPEVSLKLWKKEYFSYTATQAEDPESDISNPLMFITDKCGDYTDTILGFLDLSGLSIQEGGTYLDSDGDEVLVPSWDDTEFAEDLAGWELSKTCEKKISGSIDLTLDAVLYYDLNLSKRIMIENVIENPLNIMSMTYNLGSFTVTVNLEKHRYYKRDIPVQTHGE